MGRAQAAGLGAAAARRRARRGLHVRSAAARSRPRRSRLRARGCRFTRTGGSRECNYGELNGKAAAELDAKERLRRIDEPFPGGESYRRGRRARDCFLDDLVPDETVARLADRALGEPLGAAASAARGAARRAIEAPFEWQEGWELHVWPVQLPVPGLDSSYGQGAGAGDGIESPLEPRLPRIGSVDAVALEERSATLAKRSIKREAALFALDLAVRMMDLTTLEGADTPGKVAGAFTSKGIRPDPADLTRPLGRRDLRLSEPRADGGRAHAWGPASRSRRLRPGSLPVQIRRRQGRARSARWPRWARTRSTWSSIVSPSSRAATRRSTTRCPGEGSGRRRAPEGDPRDRRARHVRQRPAGEPARDCGRRGLHQDLDRAAPVRGDPAGDARACSRRSATWTRRRAGASA